eukprot:NODE_4778_length_763_cov_3.281513_g4430_i0.p1 GENE.NODE_4778_length_763_cov_3.281513_g4430_i0~~NODE_4778_length_763_cov_3.281513_g4430_i0.p1  ORF type:complete len:246 (-),score=28.44 NODE_4778_length_763_cov_3.281513_g4430_i0:26-703(-)
MAGKDGTPPIPTKPAKPPRWQLFNPALFALILALFLGYHARYYSQLASLKNRMLTSVKILHVLDGNSIIIQPEGQGKVTLRLQGSWTLDPRERLGMEASHTLSYLLQKGNVSAVLYGAGEGGAMRGDLLVDRCSKPVTIMLERAGKAVPSCEESQTITVQEVLISLGLAWHHNMLDHRAVLSEAMDHAAANKFGFWSADQPMMPPWIAERREAHDRARGIRRPRR